MDLRCYKGLTLTSGWKNGSVMQLLVNPGLAGEENIISSFVTFFRDAVKPFFHLAFAERFEQHPGRGNYRNTGEDFRYHFHNLTFYLDSCIGKYCAILEIVTYPFAGIS